ncbi:MAG: hypothetical protein JWO13_1209 [Acidobacteriales bacterium]|nr:hypothetical protein [Terriglobales bacterium]
MNTGVGLVPAVRYRVQAIALLIFAAAILWHPNCMAQNSVTEKAPVGSEQVGVSPAISSREVSEKKPVATPDETATGNVKGAKSLERAFAVNFIKDQRAIWRAPLGLRRKDAYWLVPAAALTGELLHRDAYLYEALTPAVNSGTRSKTFSDAAVIALAGGVGGFYIAGRMKGNDHARETGVLGTEAVLNSIAVASALKYALRRQRPFDGNGRGDFFSSGGDSFPSEHAIVAWSAASVIAHEYPGPLTKIGAYGLATAVSLARVTGRQHFPTDVVIGSALGYGIGTLVYKKHHNLNLPGEDIGIFSRPSAEEPVLGSPYVPLDSWMYPALERLAALGYVKSGFSGLRPWTRSECARQLAEAENADFENRSADLVASRLITELKSELRDERDVATGRTSITPRFESIYTRVTGISGPALSDGYHFGQTIYNDFGRPYREGLNLVMGFSGWATYGRFTIYSRGEYQHSPSSPALSFSERQEISRIDSVPVQAGIAIGALNRFRLLDSYISFNLSEAWAISIGKQSLWWSPNNFGSLNFSSNAEPILMARITRAAPLALPGFLHYLGPVRGEFFVGQLAGHQFERSVTQSFGPGLKRQPLIDGGKVSFKPTPNFEYGISVTTVFGGPGFPLTTRSFLRTVVLTNTNPGEPNDPGDRRAGFDFRYRIPKLRDRLTIYNDSMTEDEISPIGYPRRSAMSPGIYLAAIPGFNHLDFRAEGYYTDLPGLRPIGSYYYNARFLSGFTNQGTLLGHTVGRQGSGFTLKSTYWFSGQNSIEVGHRRNQVSPEFVQQGGSIRDYWTKVEWKFGQIDISGKAQYERWNYPILATGERENVATSLQLTYRPRKH